MDLLLMFLVLCGIVYGVFSVLFGGSKSSAARKVLGDSAGAKSLLLGIFRPNAVTRRKGAKFLSDKEIKKQLNPRNSGLLIDGDKLRLTPQSSFTHCMVVAPTGAGKSTRYVLPNLLTLDNCSFIVTDPSGELHEKSAAALRAKGFDILVVEPSSPSTSLCYNPLAGIQSYNDITEISKTLVRSSIEGEMKAGDSFWYDGAADLISVLIRCLISAGDEYLNLGNLLYLLQNFEGDGRGLVHFLEKHADEAALNQFKGIITGNSNVVQSFVSTALTSLSLLNNPDLANLMSTNEVDFSQLRKKKTALFFIIPSEKIKSYSFIMNLLYKDFFGAMLSTTPDQAREKREKYLPVYALMDEFGHSRIPDFEVICTTIRKYQVSLSIIIQNFSQLETNYGEAQAKTIIEGGMQSRIFYPGLPYDTARAVEHILGKEVIEEVRWNGEVSSSERNLMNADRIRTLPDDNAIFLNFNKEAMLIDTIPSYGNKRFHSQLKKKNKSSRISRTIPPFQRVSLS